MTDDWLMVDGHDDDEQGSSFSEKNSKPKHHMNVVLNIIIELWKSTRINPDILFSINLDDCP